MRFRLVEPSGSPIMEAAWFRQGEQNLPIKQIGFGGKGYPSGTWDVPCRGGVEMICGTTHHDPAAYTPPPDWIVRFYGLLNRVFDITLERSTPPPAPAPDHSVFGTTSSISPPTVPFSITWAQLRTPVRLQDGDVVAVEQGQQLASDRAEFRFKNERTWWKKVMIWADAGQSVVFAETQDDVVTVKSIGTVSKGQNPALYLSKAKEFGNHRDIYVLALSPTDDCWGRSNLLIWKED